MVERVIGPSQEFRKLSCHGVDFYARHPILIDCARDLGRSLGRSTRAKVDVYVGVHKVDSPLDTGRFKVGIQTEQIDDAQGQEMWRSMSSRALRRFAKQYDLLLDLSPDNAAAYLALSSDLRKKVILGPHIFPTSPVSFTFLKADPIFFGNLNDRRRRIIEALRTTREVTIAPRRTFGRELDTLISQHSSVLNVHFVDAVYSEYPRFLKAYLLGKPMVSERMSAPLMLGTHYLDLEAMPDEDASVRIFKNVVEWSHDYSLQHLLESATL